MTTSLPTCIRICSFSNAPILSPQYALYDLAITVLRVFFGIASGQKHQGVMNVTIVSNLT